MSVTVQNNIDSIGRALRRNVLQAESEATAVVFGMPRAAIEIGAAVEVLPLDRIARALVREFQEATALVGAGR